MTAGPGPAAGAETAATGGVPAGPGCGAAEAGGSAVSGAGVVPDLVRTGSGDGAAAGSGGAASGAANGLSGLGGPAAGQHRGPDAYQVATKGPVLVVGTGLLGTSLALALTAAGVEVQLADTSPTSLALARDMGAGQVRTVASPEPALVVVATPPDVAAAVVVQALREHPQAVVTDVASVKARIAEQVAAAGEAARRYVGSHPMAGRERSGAGAAHSELFVGRPWVLVAGQADPAAVLEVRNLVVDVGATPVRMEAAEQDAAVAAVSHLPQLVSSLLAARLERLPESALALAGQGLRDTTRIAASDPRLWAAILVGNAGPVSVLLRELRADLDELIAGLEREASARAEQPEPQGTGLERTSEAAGVAATAGRTAAQAATAGPRGLVPGGAATSGTTPAAVEPGSAGGASGALTASETALAPEARGSTGLVAPGAVGAIMQVMSRGNAGQARIPGKHGGAPRRYAQVQVLVPDQPGELGRLFSEVGAAGVNIEDFAMEHSPGQRAGVAMLSVLPGAAQGLETALEEGGWRLVRA